jgi:hypothetical protein
VDPGDAERIEQPGRVVGKAADRVGSRVGAGTGLADVAVVVGDHPELASDRRHLQIPGAAIGADAVDQQDRLAGRRSGALPRDVEVAHPRRRHAFLLSAVFGSPPAAAVCQRVEPDG